MISGEDFIDAAAQWDFDKVKTYLIDGCDANYEDKVCE